MSSRARLPTRPHGVLSWRARRAVFLALFTVPKGYELRRGEIDDLFLQVKMLSLDLLHKKSTPAKKKD